jgi:hypothetical protein
MQLPTIEQYQSALRSLAEWARLYEPNQNKSDDLQIAVSMLEEAILEVAWLRIQRISFPQGMAPLPSMKHGQPAYCPECGGPGRLDLSDSPEPAFDDAIWRHPEDNRWYCTECFLK